MRLDEGFKMRSENSIRGQTISVLVSTMNQDDYDELMQGMNLIGNVVIINQITDLKNVPNNLNDKLKHNIFRSFEEKGLSRSRNRAMSMVRNGICVVADDDMRYEKNYKETISSAYVKYPDADIIAFFVDSDDDNLYKAPLREGRVRLLTSMKIRSVQITFRKESISSAHIAFDESFGAGTADYMGEENMFLAVCIRAGLKVYSVPEKIATLEASESTWFRGYTKEFFTIKGKIFRKISPLLAPLLALRFAVRKRHLYQESVSFFDAVIWMLRENKNRNEVL